MSKHSSPALTMRDALYEAPGPKMRAKIRIGTAISLVAVAALVALVLQRFAEIYQRLLPQQTEGEMPLQIAAVVEEHAQPRRLRIA